MSSRRPSPGVVDHLTGLLCARRQREVSQSSRWAGTARASQFFFPEVAQFTALTRPEVSQPGQIGTGTFDESLFHLPVSAHAPGCPALLYRYGASSIAAEVLSMFASVSMFSPMLPQGSLRGRCRRARQTWRFEGID